MTKQDYNKTEIHNYNLEKTLLGGQSFNWDFIDGWYYGFFVDKVVKLKLENNDLLWQTYPENDNYEFVKNYLRLDENYDSILALINKDKTVATAIKKHPNLRVLKQDFDQTLISYIISANKNINSIRQVVRKLSFLLGDKIIIDGKEIYLFPKISRIADAPIELLLETRAGYRARYIQESAIKLQNEGLKISNDESEMREWLLEFLGIGEKVADAILQYSLGFNNVTPLDVWMQKIFVDFYGIDSKMKYQDMRSWFQGYFNGYAGWAGQFLFECYRK